MITLKFPSSEARMLSVLRKATGLKKGLSNAACLNMLLLRYSSGEALGVQPVQYKSRAKAFESISGKYTCGFLPLYVYEKLLILPWICPA